MLVPCWAAAAALGASGLRSFPPDASLVDSSLLWLKVKAKGCGVLSSTRTVSTLLLDLFPPRMMGFGVSGRPPSLFVCFSVGEVLVEAGPLVCEAGLPLPTCAGAGAAAAAGGVGVFEEVVSKQSILTWP